MLARIEWRIEGNRNIYVVESHISGPYLIYVNITKYALKKKGQRNKCLQRHMVQIIEFVLRVKNDLFLRYSLAMN